MLRRAGTGRQLAFVLSALRGPDSDHSKSKNQTTEFIRTNAFPTLAAEGTEVANENIWLMASRPVPRDPIDLNEIEERENYHFTSHVANAFIALGIPFTWQGGPARFQGYDRMNP